MEFVVATALRVLAPLTVLRWPLPGVLLSMAIDVYDWNFFDITSYDDNSVYQNWDRVMDMYFWFVTLFMVRRWEDTTAKYLAFILFAFRMIGQILFFLTQDRSFLFFFPNFYDNFLVMYLGYVLIFKRTRLLTSIRDVVVVFSLLMIPKIIHEYFLHFLRQQPWEIYNVAEFLGVVGGMQYYVNYVIWSALFYFLPFLAVFLYFRWSLRHSGQERRMGDHAMGDRPGGARGLESSEN